MFLRSICLLLSVSALLHAEIELPRVLSSHMVLQRSAEVTLWGWAGPGEEIVVDPDWGEPRSTKAGTDGTWQLKVKTNSDPNSHSITFRAGNETTRLTDIRFGEVWLASGQSNMEMPLAAVSGAYTGIRDAKQEIAAANYPDIRLFQVGNFSSYKPLTDVRAGNTIYGVPPAKCTWQRCSPKTVKHFSSTAYFFARELHRQLDVPIGIIDASWGGTKAEVWTPREGLEKLGYDKLLRDAKQAKQNQDEKIASRLYNGMIHPLRNTTIRGAIWYQGESNVSTANRYRELFVTMIGHWRKDWGYDFPFYFTQISPYRYKDFNSSLLREAQFNSMSIPNTGMAVTMDIGNIRDIHPKNKQEVGRRLALWALAKDYQRNIDYSGPAFRSATTNGDRIRIAFDYAENGLTTSNGKPPSHFEIAGQDHKFHSAKAEIEGQAVVVYSPSVSKPIAVRYAFSNEATPNLTDKSGLPASSFRTDRD